MANHDSFHFSTQPTPSQELLGAVWEGNLHGCHSNVLQTLAPECQCHAASSVESLTAARSAMATLVDSAVATLAESAALAVPAPALPEVLLPVWPEHPCPPLENGAGAS